MTDDMSTSLKVVSIAASCWAATRRCAIFARKGDILRRVWREDGCAVGEDGCAMGAGDGVTGETGFDSPAPCALPLAAAGAASMSPLVTRPALPVPVTLAGSTPVSAAIRRTAGDCAVASAA